MNLDTLDAVFYTTAFLVPGFVWSSVLSMLVPRKTHATEVRLLEFLTLSCVNHGLWSWATFLVLSSGADGQFSNWAALYAFFVLFASPVGLGLLSGYLRQRDRVAVYLDRLGFRTISPEPTAWDYYFSRSKPAFLIVRLTDGSRVYGLFGQNSIAGDSPEQRDLYLEATYQKSRSGEWELVENTGGMLIKAEQIAIIEVRKITE